MNRKELTKTLKMVSKRKKLWSPWLLQKEFSALRVNITKQGSEFFVMDYTIFQSLKLFKIYHVVGKYNTAA